MPDLRAGEAHADAARRLADSLQKHEPDLLQTLLARGTLEPSMMTLILDAEVLARALGVPRDSLAPDLTTIRAPVALRRRGIEAKLVIGRAVPGPDPVLLRSLRDAHRWTAALQAGTPLTTIATSAGHCPPHIRTRMALAFLSPKIQAALLDGSQPAEMCHDRLVRQVLPLDWTEQERLCGML